MIRVTVWNENVHEKVNPKVAEIYPDGIHGAIAAGLTCHDGYEVRTATLDQPDHGLSENLLDSTDVLIWWGHKAHKEVRDEIVERVYQRVLSGMGLIVLHSGHFSKIFKKLMGTTCDLKWRDANDKERLWVVNHAHPITDGIGEYIDLQAEEMYGEHFDIPQPDELLFISWFSGGEVFRSGCTYQRGQGRIFYFRPGHETYPTYHHPKIQLVIANGVKWAAKCRESRPIYGNFKPLEQI